MSRFGRREQLSPLAVYGVDARWIYRGVATPQPGMPPSYTYRLLFANGRRLDLSAAVTSRGKIDGVMYRRH